MLEELGWDAAWERVFAGYGAEGWLPARLCRDNKISYGALLADGSDVEVVLSGKVYHEAVTDAELPAVGDWVAVDSGADGQENVIRARLPRRTCLSRKTPGKSSEEQVMAANVDCVMVVTDCGADFSPARLERYFTLIARSGAQPVVVINKADLFPAAESRAAAEAIRALQPGVETHVTSARKPRTLAALRRHLKRGVTLTLVGSSGVGKSTLLNELLGEDYQWTDEVNESTGKGRHTTTARELILLPGGGVLIDNPGIREVQMWTDETTLRESYLDIQELAASCRFHDCKHRSDAGCAIQAALGGGRLEAGRYEGFLLLDAEIERLRRKRKKRQMTLERRTKREMRERDKRMERRGRGDRH